MRIKSALAALAGGVLLLAALACETDTPPPVAPLPAATATPISAPVAAATATPRPTPVPTATPSPIPTATPLPEGVGICYRTPEVQEWIIGQLQIPACRLITEPELYRIKTEFRVNAELRPGDLSGLANVSSVYIHYGHCGDWEDPEYVAAMLDGLNPAAVLWIEVPVDWAGFGDWPRFQILEWVIWDSRRPDGMDPTEYGLREGLSESQVERLIELGNRLKRQVNPQARSIAFVAAQVRGKEDPLIRILDVGRAVFGNPVSGNDPSEPGSISVSVNLGSPGNQPLSIPECRGE